METNAYQQALDYLYSFVDFSRTHQQNLSPENFDLQRMRSLMTSLENPQDAYQTIHVAGSKGKGSVCALCASALQAESYRVGLYTSPHLRDFTERIQINGEQIPGEELVQLVEEIKPHVAAIPRLTTFEITTALAFWYFQRQQVDVAVIEVGLGGRLDATNVITPVVSVITALFLEHTQILGHSIEEIAAEKAGIIKPGVPLVLGPQQEAARKVVCQIADQRAAPVISVEEHFPYALQSFSLDGQRFFIRRGVDEEDGAGQELSISLLGTHQVENAAIAYATLRVAGGQGLKISDQAIRRGFARARWPARFEVVSRQPPLILDSAHIPDAARKLRVALDDYFPSLPVILVIGVSEDKDVRHMLIELQPRVRMVIATQSDHPRALDTTVLAEVIEDLGLPVKPIPVVKNALVEALRLAGEEAIVLVTGSIFVAASARIAWLEELSPMPRVSYEAR